MNLFLYSVNYSSLIIIENLIRRRNVPMFKLNVIILTTNPYFMEI